MIDEFDRYIRSCVFNACKEWGYPEPQDNFFIKLYKRLPEGLRYLLGTGIVEGIIISQGRAFSLRGLSSDKGPYNWFSRSASTKEPTPNWEYYVQVAE